jgi:uncharacterized protein
MKLYSLVWLAQKQKDLLKIFPKKVNGKTQFNFERLDFQKIVMEELKPANDFEKDNVELLDLIISQFKLDIDGDHGISHWRKVLDIGNYLAKETKADIKIINFFAYLHDAKKEDDAYDSEHGRKAGVFAQELFAKKLLPLSEEQLGRLLFACQYHADGMVKKDDITIQTCWDADRLDLWRVGVMPDKELLSTDFAKQSVLIFKSQNILEK